MALVSGSIPNLINGVSQQPFALRLASQAEHQENAYSSVVEGLIKRPSTRHVAKLSSGDFSSAYLHTINRDANERYEVIITNGDLFVYDFSGNPRTVNFPNGKGYLSNPAADTGFSSVTVADYTFLVNKSKKVTLAPDVAPSRPPEALVWVKQGNYASTYSITINGTTYSYSSSDVDPESIKTDAIAKELFTTLGAGSRATGSLTFKAIPKANDMISLGGQTFVFRAAEAIGADGYITFPLGGNLGSGVVITLNGMAWSAVPGTPTAGQFQTGPTLQATLANLVTALRASTDGRITVADYYTKDDDKLYIVFKQPGPAGNSYTIASNYGAPSGSTLTGGYDNNYTVPIKATVYDTLLALLDKLSKAPNPEVQVCTYRATASTLLFEYKHRGTTGNLWPYGSLTNSSIVAAGGTLTGGASPQAGILVGLHGSTLHIVRSDSSDFSISVADSAGDQSLKVVKGHVQNFTDLPTKAVPGFLVEVSGAPNNAFDNFYVVYSETGGAQGGGVWKETAKPGRQIKIDPSSMLHVLVREADGTFTFRQETWANAAVGDEETNPHPTFVGLSLSDVFFFRNRLGVIADENVIFSRSGDFFNFYRSTVTDVLDTDPIDVAVSHNRVSILRHTLPFNESLLLFSEQTQFTLTTAEILSPAALPAINQTTEFETSARVRPVGVGRFVYFATNKSGFTGIREFYVDGNTKTKDAQEITSHVPKYLRGNATKISASTNEDVLLVLTEDERNVVYVYKWFFSGTEKVQSSWSKWVFAPGDKVLNADFIESTLWLVIQRSDGLYLEKMELQYGQVDLGLPYAVLLDRRVDETKLTRTYNAGTGRTTIVLPYPSTAALQVVAYGAGAGRYKPGQIVNHETVSPTAIEVAGDVTSGHLIVGLPYIKRWTFSPFQIREEAPGGGLVAKTEGRLQVRRVEVNYADTGYFKATVTPVGRDPYVYTFTGRVVGSGRSPLGAVAIESGSFRFPVMANNLGVEVEIINDKPVPSRLLNADWEGNWTPRAQRVL